MFEKFLIGPVERGVEPIRNLPFPTACRRDFYVIKKYSKFKVNISKILVEIILYCISKGVQPNSTKIFEILTVNLESFLIIYLVSAIWLIFEKIYHLIFKKRYLILSMFIILCFWIFLELKMGNCKMKSLSWIV